MKNDLIFYPTLLLGWAVVTAFRRLQRPPYGIDDFAQASKRIVAGTAGLAWRLEGAQAGAGEGLVLPEWAGPESKALRRGCRLLLRDIRDSTNFMLRLASRVSCDALRRSEALDRAAIWKNLMDVHTAGQSVRRQVRHAGLELAFRGLDRGQRSTLEAARQHAVVCGRLGGILDVCRIGHRG